jgi:WD40 repeat protein
MPRPASPSGSCADMRTRVDVASDRSGDHVVTASADATARVWDVKPQESLGVLAGSVSSVAFDSEGQRLAT